MLEIFVEPLATALSLSPMSNATPSQLAALTFAIACLVLQTLPAWADSGFYTGLSNGVAVLATQGGQSLDTVPGARLLGHEGDRLTATTLYGGYRFSRAFALEAGRTSFGAGVNVDDPVLYATPAEQLSAWSLAGVGSMELTDSVTIFAKLGVNFAPDAPYGNLAVDAPSRPGRVYGFGVSYQVTGRFELRAQSERYTGLGQTSNGTLEANALTLGARLKF